MKKIYIIAATLALLTSCSNENTPNISSDKVPLIIKSASSYDFNTKGAFANETKVVLIANGDGYNNYQTVYQFNKWGSDYNINPLAPYSWGPTDKDKKIMLSLNNINITAYTPELLVDAIKDVNNNNYMKFECKEYNNTWVESYNSETNYDFCVVKDQPVSMFTNGLSINLKHINSLLTFNFTKDTKLTFPSGDIKEVRLIGPGLKSTAYFNQSDFSWISQTGEETGTLSSTLDESDTAFNSGTTAKANLLVPPQTLVAGSTYTLRINIDNLWYKIEIPYTANTFDKFESNKRYIIDLAFTATGVSLTSVERAEWGTIKVTDGTPLKPE